MEQQVTIATRFRGPAESGNGGYSCGIVASALGPAPVEVTLRLPPPLERPLELHAHDGEAVMRSGEAVVAEARATQDLELDLPEPIDVERAAAAREASPLHRHHPFPECFVCGPQRHAGDGLCVVCGPVGSDLVASPWEVDDTVVDDDGLVRPEIVWAALDCPGGLSGLLVPEIGTCVLGRLAARSHRAIRAGTTCVAIGWPIDVEGRKFRTGSAIFSTEGELLAEALGTWIELKR